MKNFTLLFILSFILVNTASADVFSSDKFTLRAGLSFNLTQIHTDRLIDHTEIEDDGRPEDETKTVGLGFVTSIGYRFGNWEFAMAGDVIFGGFTDISFDYNSSNTIRGGGHFRLVSIGPQIKYYTPYSILNLANVYFGFGPSWSLQTFVFRHPITTGGFNDKKRVSFENYGGSLFIGFEEIKPFKEMHPIFLEFGYSYMHSYKVSILDASNSANVITLTEGDSNDFSGQYVIVRAGMALF
jgi:hypothetical protein